MRELWLVEGLPGAGKTTTAEQLCVAAISEGWAARWWLEEAKDHPVLPSRLRARSFEPGFPDLCLEAFDQFLGREEGVLILEGAAFQNTVRFMFANDAARSAIEGYVAAWAEVVSSPTTRLAMLTVANPLEHYRDFVLARRGEAWMRKLVAYVEATPVAQRKDWAGLTGFVQFWSDYQALCRDLVGGLPFETLTFAARPARADGLAKEILDFFGLPRAR
ncbi:MAG TPA: hypothetical protein VFW47_10295 [Phenylobacterium sp.]|nr:hypothetical protein [Phenylobacterium sp.]